MTWLLLIAFGITVLIALSVMLVLTLSVVDDGRLERARVELEVAAAERHLHAVTRNMFEAMLEEARTQNRVRRT